MAALETFEWIVEQSMSNSDIEMRQLVQSERNYLLTIRSEDERQRYLEVLLSHMRDLKKKRNVA